ncbi:metallophosphoesterase [Belliella kenyensis]|uniref:Metallophosphoesterase n=1 Tax=Belliella kenyensis TaxID=1472724 RepID=A0ABV8EKJ0_9BACT|nr:metallophosphoesterase [Belliella kenyensis]MCH7400478.1 metallophosphoesterase [Belliella kenyensis]MDN3604506.1 metallophosphoesterase [Belliella kenyensis]
MNQVGGLIFLIALFLFSTFLNWYVFQAYKTILSGMDSERTKHVLNLLYWLIFGGVSIWVVYTFQQIFKAGEISYAHQHVLNVFLTIVVTQLVCTVFLFGEDIFRNIQAGFSLLMNGKSATSFPSRLKWLSMLALAISMVPLTSFVYGITKGKYNFTVHKEVIYFDDLPEAFDGFTITQLSDIHAGSFKDMKAVKKGVDLAIAQQSDLFVFTGDLVNHEASEIDPMIDIFNKIKAPFGQFSIIGNHDYGDYVSWESKDAKAENFKKFINQHSKLGYNLLIDEHVTIEKDGQHIILVGVQNWGKGFQSKGDLQKALEGVDPQDFKILLSHDPSHWDYEVKVEPRKIHLTLSGHTHGMQFGIETPIIKWSPVQYRYPNWAGLTDHEGRFLYVNRGFGFHAFSGRVGIWPEITVIELRKKR